MPAHNPVWPRHCSLLYLMAIHLFLCVRPSSHLDVIFDNVCSYSAFLITGVFIVWIANNRSVTNDHNYLFFSTIFVIKKKEFSNMRCLYHLRVFPLTQLVLMIYNVHEFVIIIYYRRFFPCPILTVSILHHIGFIFIGNIYHLTFIPVLCSGFTLLQLFIYTAIS